MDNQLRSILTKLAEARTAATLSEGELGYIERLLGQRAAPAANEARPLYAWMRRQAFLHRNLFRIYLDTELDPILAEAAPGFTAMSHDAEEKRYLTAVTRDALTRAVRRHLTHQSPGTRAHAARLIGYCELDDCAPLLVESLETGREERANWGIPVIAGSIESLAMLRHPSAAKFAAAYVSHDDYSIKTAAQVAYLLTADPLDREVFRKLLGGTYDATLIKQFPRRFAWAAREGLYTEDDLDRHANEVYDLIGRVALAEIVVAARWQESYAKLLARDIDYTAALALRVAWTDERWAGPLLRERLDAEQGDDSTLAIVAALGSFGDEYKPLIEASFGSDRASARCGAAWACVGRPGWFEPELKKLLEDLDFTVRRAASCALAANAAPPAPEAVELKWNELLNVDTWWPWAVPAKALESSGLELPDAVRGFEFIAEDLKGDRAALDQGIEFYRRKPMELVRYLQPDTPETERFRAFSFASLVGGSTLAGAAEIAFLGSPSLFEGTHAYRELAAMGEPIGPLAEQRGRLGLEVEPRAAAGSLASALVLAHHGQVDTRERGIKALAGLGAEAEPYLSMLLVSSFGQLAQAAADVAGQLQGADDPFVADVARLMNSDARSVSELTTVDLLVSCPAPKVRSKLAETLGLPSNRREEVVPYLIKLAADRDPEVAAVALACLATHAGDQGWLRELILQNTWSDDYRVREKAVQAMAQVADPSFIERLMTLSTDQDFNVAEHSVRGLLSIAARHPELGLVVLDIRQPYRVADRYGLAVQVNYGADEHSEALRLLLLALEERRDAAAAAAYAGRKVMLTPAAAGLQATPAEARWSIELFEQLALNLKVVFTDEESGTVIAEVGPDATGEVLSALLQTGTVSVTTVAWS